MLQKLLKSALVSGAVFLLLQQYATAKAQTQQKGIGSVIKPILENLFPFWPPIPGPGGGSGGGGGGSGGGAKNPCSNLKPPNHPLDSLSEAEINCTAYLIKAYSKYVNGDYMFSIISLNEPQKSILLPFFLQNQNPPTSIPRRSTTILLKRSTNQAFIVIVNLSNQKVESWDQGPDGATPPFTPQELLLCEKIALEDSRVKELSAKAGYNDTKNLVAADPWSPGFLGDKPQYNGLRLCQLYVYGKNFPDDNHYAHPFDFLVMVDLLAKKVIDIEDLPTHDDFNASNKEGNTVPRQTDNYDREVRRREGKSIQRRDLIPVQVSQRGTSFSMNGNEISWQRFKMRLGFNGREGLVIYNLNYNDEGKVRPLFYRMSLAEMFIPYGDPRPPYYRKHVFDEGEYGVGFNTNSLQPHRDCVGEVKYIDAALNDEDGAAYKTPRVVCIHEIDDGILWKHTDYRNGKNDIVRNQRLALTFIATVGNYDYIYTWKFSLDGTVEFHVKLTGILSVNLLATNATPAGHGSVVFPQINAQYHQHFFSLRLDSEIDGNENSVVMTDVVAGPGETGSTINPYGQAWTIEKTLLETAESARTNVNAEKSRVWVVTNPNSIHPYTNSPVGWKMMPFPTPPMLLQKTSPIFPRAAWMEFNTWVLPYQEGQLYPGDLFLNKSGLHTWVENNPSASVNNVDIVFWHNFGLSHVPRVEDYPVMPYEACYFIMKPYNFFKTNPAIDVQPPAARNRREL